MKGFRLFVVLLSWHPDATRFVLPLTRKAGFWLAGLYREGVEPSGSLRKVSDHVASPLSCPPDASDGYPLGRPTPQHIELMPKGEKQDCARPEQPGHGVTRSTCHMSRKVKEVIRAAGLRDELSFASFRHGGFTEAGDAEPTEQELMAQGRHKSRKVLGKYVKRTMRQVDKGLQKRHAERTKSGQTSVMSNSSSSAIED
jgi:hypothetical protein